MAKAQTCFSVDRILLLMFILAAFSTIVNAGDIEDDELTVRPYLIYYRGVKLDKQNINKLGKYNLIIVDRFRHHEVGKNTWAALRKLNPEITIYLYQMGVTVNDKTDNMTDYYLNNVGRYNTARGSSKGSINKDHPEWMLEGLAGGKVRLKEDGYYLDVGDKDLQEYWLEATEQDIVMRKWSADGIFIDLCMPLLPSPLTQMNDIGFKKYRSQVGWNSAMNSFINYVVAGLASNNQKVFCNRGYTIENTGLDAWVSLDAAQNPPALIMEEGAFAVWYGFGDVKFFSEEQWLRQVSIPARIKHSSVAYVSHTDLDEGGIGFDNYRNKVDFNQVFNFSLGSYLLAKTVENMPSYFTFDFNVAKGGGYRRLTWTPVYEELKLGKPLKPFYKEEYDGFKIYRGDFKNGYVMVNPASTPAKSVKIPATTQLILDWKTGIKTKELTSKVIEIGPHQAVFFGKNK